MNRLNYKKVAVWNEIDCTVHTVGPSPGEAPAPKKSSPQKVCITVGVSVSASEYWLRGTNKGSGRVQQVLHQSHW